MGAMCQMSTVQGSNQEASHFTSPSTMSIVRTTGADAAEAGASPLVVSVGKPLSCDHQVHELYSGTDSEAYVAPRLPTTSSSGTVTIKTALLARVEYLEAENQQLRKAQVSSKNTGFSIEQIAHDLKLVWYWVLLLYDPVSLL